MNKLEKEMLDAKDKIIQELTDQLKHVNEQFRHSIVEHAQCYCGLERLVEAIEENNERKKVEALNWAHNHIAYVHQKMAESSQGKA